MKRFFLFLLPALLALVQLSSRAEDIDLFAGTSADQNIAPNLLLILDNGANFGANASGTTCIIDGVPTLMSGKTGGVEQCALYNVINNLDLSSGVPVNLGIMVYNGNNVLDFQGNSCFGSIAGCLVYPLTPLNATSRPILLNWIKSWKDSGSGFGFIKGPNSGNNGAVMQEGWAYLNGRMGLSGRNYASIAPDTSCKNFVVFIGNAFNPSGSAGDSTGDAGPRNALEGLNSVALKNADPPATTVQKALIKLTNGVTPATTVCGSVNFPGDNNHENSGFHADEWTRYMYANRITTYTIGFHGTGCKAEYAWLLSSMASNGGGTYFATSNYQQLVEALQTVLSEVRSVNSVFAAVSLPVSVNSQGTYLNQVFIGMFRPDQNGFPRWMGNLKQYKMGFLASTGAFSLLDADDNLAISASGSEFIGECARSYWTPSATSTGDGYWVTLTDPNCIGFPASSNSPDGNLVEKGGQAFRLRSTSPAARVVKTCAASVSGCSTLTDFSTANTAITASTLGIPTGSTVTRDTLINWARGSNNHASSPESAQINGVALTAANMSPSSHGDVVHSRPAAVNFGTDATPKVVVFYAGNDGMLRAINGNRSAAFSANGSTVAAGEEFWSFVAPEFHDKLLRRYNNGAADTITPSNRKDYAMDGPITAYRTSSGDAWIYVGMRRGGRALYAFHVNGSTLAISLKWKRGCADAASTNCSDSASGDFTGIGQTWSPPQIFTAKGVNSGATPLLIMGGGYDATCEDAMSYTCSSTKGNRIYVLNADTGALLRTFTTTRGVAADVTIVPAADGHAKFIYAADLAGNIYRISGALTDGQFTALDIQAPASWAITTVASVGCATLTTCTSPPNRKFMFAPDVVVDGSGYLLLLGSGDREKPTNISNSTANYFFMVKDRPDLGPTYLADTTNCGTGATTLCLSSLLAITQGSTPSDSALAAKKGWYLSLAANEQVVTGAIAVFGTVYFTTHQPMAAASSACVPNLGRSRSYGIKYTNASAARPSGDIFLARDDAGLAPDLVVGKVTLDNNSTVPFCIGCDGPIKPSQPTTTSALNNPAKIRSYWYIQR
jgi:type IV pilus assembly protein PilY1